MERTFVSNAASHLWAAVALVTAAVSTTVVLAQSPTGGQKDMAVHKPMMGWQKAAMAAAHEKLFQLVARMEAVKGDEKLAAMAAVVNELVAQRKEMQEQMRMQGGMMERMMSHMGAMHGPPGSSPTLEQPKETA